MNNSAKFYARHPLLVLMVLSSAVLWSACSTMDDSVSPPPPPLTEAQQKVLQDPFASFVQKLQADTGIKLVPIPAGTFMMGSLPENVHHNSNKDEIPQTRVTLTRNFFISATDITQEQYEAVTGKNPSLNDRLAKDYPVEMVSWDDAMEFCQKLTRKELPRGLLPEGFIMTLPTEAQWEYACRAGTTGPNPDNLDAIAWYDNNSFHHTHAVAKKLPNAWGLYDMQGNVVQWCLDGYGPYPGGEVTDPIGTGVGTGMVLRGGFAESFAWDCSPTARGTYNPSHRENGIGFRIVLVQP